MILLVGTGLYLTIRTRLIQFRGMGHGFAILRGTYDRKDDPGEISHFRALSTALSATIGTGNIVGVATAVLTGGPGALFWMWITALVGMCTKFTSCTLAVHFRRIDERGEAHGGPMHYIEMGMGARWKWLAVLFATFTAIASFGIGNMFQANNMAAAVNTIFLGHEAKPMAAINWAVGVSTALLVAVVILGGIKRIAAFAARLVPLMCAFYVLTGLIILVLRIDAVPHAFGLIFTQAFQAPEALGGGLLGTVIQAGVRRGLFSNEAGLGSAAMAHGAARTSEPVREGLVAMLGPFIDTLVICTITGLVIICTGVHELGIEDGRLTSAAFDAAIRGSGALVSIAIVLFAFSTLVSWSYYGDRAVDYLFGPQAVPVYRWAYVLIILVGATIKLGTVINFCDGMNGLMAIPNLIALIVLAPVVVKLTSDYLARMKADR
jgi:AGCS family alanine or glycine:cation symporter